MPLQVLFNGALPSNDCTPPRPSELMSYHRVAGDGCFEFRPPEGTIRSRYIGKPAVAVPVPETAVDQDHCAIPGQYNVRSPGQFLHMNTEPESQTVQS